MVISDGTMPSIFRFRPMFTEADSSTESVLSSMGSASVYSSTTWLDTSVSATSVSSISLDTTVDVTIGSPSMGPSQGVEQATNLPPLLVDSLKLPDIGVYQATVIGLALFLLLSLGLLAYKFRIRLLFCLVSWCACIFACMNYCTCSCGLWAYLKGCWRICCCCCRPPPVAQDPPVQDAARPSQSGPGSGGQDADPLQQMREWPVDKASQRPSRGLAPVVKVEDTVDLEEVAVDGDLEDEGQADMGCEPAYVNVPLAVVVEEDEDEGEEPVYANVPLEPQVEILQDRPLPAIVSASLPDLNRPSVGALGFLAVSLLSVATPKKLSKFEL